MKVVIAGSRDITDENLLLRVVPVFEDRIGLITTVVCGCARGADTVGKKWAEKAGIPVIPCPADWKTFGGYAGYHRNEEMADISHAGIFLWDGKSRGTKHMILCLKAQEKPYLIINPAGVIEDHYGELVTA